MRTICVGVGILLMAATMAQAEELLYNGGFEVGFPNAPDAWYYGSGWFPSQTYPNLFKAHDGAACAGWDSTANYGDYWLAAQWIGAVDPGDQLTASVWKKNTGWADTWGITLQINEFDVGGTYLRTKVGDLHGGNTNWQQISDSFVVSPDTDAVMFNIVYRGENGATTYIDDASLLRVPEPVSCLLLLGGGVWIGIRRKI
jgi:hypothetical protein